MRVALRGSRRCSTAIVLTKENLTIAGNAVMLRSHYSEEWLRPNGVGAVFFTRALSLAFLRFARNN